MAGIFNIDLSGVSQVVGSVGGLAQTIGSLITGKLPPAEQAAVTQHLADLEATAQNAQAEIDKVEAGSSKLFVAGWRPFIGWCCGAVMAYNYILGPLLMLIPGMVKLPTLGFGEISPVLMALLGIGTMRTVEKVNGVQGNH